MSPEVESARLPRTHLERQHSDLGRWELATRGPHPELRAHVLGYIGIKSSIDMVRERHLPSGEAELLVNFGTPYRVVDPACAGRSTEHHRVTVVGVHNRSVLTEGTGVQHVLVVRFRPIGAGLFLGLPMSELTNRLVELDDIDAGLTQRVIERLSTAPDWETRFAIMDSLIAARLAAGRAPRPAMTWAWERLRDTGGRVGIGALAKELGCSHRHLVAQFREHVGLAPKAVARVLRFNRVLQRVRRADRVNWAEIAQDCGYFDQAHCIRDFRTFAGCTPTELMSRRIGDMVRE